MIFKNNKKYTLFDIHRLFVRVPLALYLSQENIYGINGVWYAILISTLFRGTAVNIGYHLIKHKYLKTIKL